MSNMNLITPGSDGGIPLPHVGRLGHRPGAGQPELEEAVFNNLQVLQQDYAKLAPCFSAAGGCSVQDPEAGQRRAAARLHRIRTCSV